jgi:wyosine [tRNA(Phe)-imidazoG37] synthetase (radical SAM superfamily)
MKYLFGPVPSRRLGLSLGLDLVPFKTCSYDCVYCELGRTTYLTIERKPFVPAEKIIKELNAFFADKDHPAVDFITLGGSGEPTLNTEIGDIIKAAKGLKKAPVAVLTNASLMWKEEVSQALLGADVILPSLDAVSEEVWQKINRPHPLLKLEKIIQGLKSFRQKYADQIWLEILFVKGINDSLEELERLKEVIKEIAPEKIQLNTVVRPPADSGISALTEPELKRIKDFFGPKAEIIVSFSRKLEREVAFLDLKDRILAMLKRRPCTIEDMSNALGVHRNEVIKIADELQKQAQITSYEHSGKKFFVVKS